MLTNFSVLAQAQLVLVPFQALAVALVVPVVDSVADSLLAEDLLVDHVLLLVTSAVDLTTSPEIVSLPWIKVTEPKLTCQCRPSSSYEVLRLRQARSHLQRLHCP